MAVMLMGVFWTVDSRFSAVTTTSSTAPDAAVRSGLPSADQAGLCSANEPASAAATAMLGLLVIFIAPRIVQFVLHDLTVSAGPITLEYVYILPGAAPIVGHGGNRRKIFRIEL